MLSLKLPPVGWGVCEFGLICSLIFYWPPAKTSFLSCLYFAPQNSSKMKHSTLIMPGEDKPASFIGKLCNILRVQLHLSSPKSTARSSIGTASSRASASSTKRSWKKSSSPSTTDTTATPPSSDSSTCMTSTRSISPTTAPSSSTTASTPKSTPSAIQQRKHPSDQKESHLWAEVQHWQAAGQECFGNCFSERTQREVRYVF